MIKLECANGEIEMLAVSGSTLDIAGDFLSVIRDVYGHMKKQNEGGAKVFKECIESGMEIVFLTDDEINEKIAKIDEETKGKAGEVIDELEKAVEELKKHFGKDEGKYEA